MRLGLLFIFSIAQDHVASQCNIFEFRGCVAPFRKYYDDALVFPSAYSVGEIDDLCRSFRYVNTCVDKLRGVCATEVAEQWQGVEDVFAFFCLQGKTTYFAHKACFSNSTVRNLAKLCNNTLNADFKRIEQQLRRDDDEAIYATEADWWRDRCRVMNSFLNCITEAVGTCGDDMREWQLEMSMLARRPSMALEGCTLGSVSKRPSVFLTLVLLMMFGAIT